MRIFLRSKKVKQVTGVTIVSKEDDFDNEQDLLKAFVEDPSNFEIRVDSDDDAESEG